MKNKFQRRIEEENLENSLNEPQIIRKNWKEKCYIYDNYDLHEVSFDIKAVGIPEQYFKACGFGFHYNSKIEIQSLYFNGISTTYTKINNLIKINIKLFNLETGKIKLIYKESKDLSKLNQGEIEERKIYRYGLYGLEADLAGQIVEYTLILKGSFEIVNFSEYFLMKNKKNVKEAEYFWVGIVPYGGKKTKIMFSKNEANWSFKISSIVKSPENIKDVLMLKTMEFIDGNNEIINIKISSPQTKNIILNKKNREYIAIFQNLGYEGELIISGELKNKCKGEWAVNITDEELESNIPEEDKKCKPQLAEIAKKIIEDFDKNNKNTDFEFLDFMKIGLWVYKNIKYDYNYIGKTEYSAIDIYNMKVGVCSHFTKLSNALLYSLGYKVITVMGYVSQINKEFNNSSSHTWSLIKINNKWYPFDSTWGIFSGKIPVSHIFTSFFLNNITIYPKSEVSRKIIRKITGKYID